MWTIVFLITNTLAQEGMCYKKNRPLSWQEACLASHNKGRASNGVGPLIWDSNLEKSALSWSIHLSKTTRTLEHSGPGENLYSGSDSCERATQLWMDEKQYFARNQLVGSGDFHSYGHYTQLVWRETARVGCAAFDGFLTCHYDPPGNVAGRNPFS